VLFLDEPTTGLDPRSRNDLWSVIGELVADGTTLLLTTQYLEEADRLADRIVVIDGGAVIAEGTSEELKGRLGATVVEVRFVDAVTAARLQPTLASIGPTEIIDDQRTVAVAVGAGASAVFALVRALDAVGVVPDRLTVREPSLDDVFLQLTGHRAEVPGTDDRADPARAPAVRGVG
jgi:ABC-2 type transport system ATP-binding protein